MEHFGTLIDECRPGERHVNWERIENEGGSEKPVSAAQGFSALCAGISAKGINNNK